MVKLEMMKPIDLQSAALCTIYQKKESEMETEKKNALKIVFIRQWCVFWIA